MPQDASFFAQWGNAALTTLGFFWMALWAFVLGYVISSMIQVFVTEERMQKTLGEAEGKSVGLAAFFGFVSSSCSFAALATTKSLFKKGAGFIPALAFLLASTNLVIELGIVIAVFLSWHFVVGEYLGGLLLIAFMWLFVRLTRPEGLIQRARERLDEDDDGDEDGPPDWRKLIQQREGWARVGMRYVGEWRMVWKDVTFGFTVAGIIAAFVPPTFFETLFIGSGGEGDPVFWEVLAQTLIGPVAAFATFIGSMGNIPLAALLYGNGVAFAGVMAFIFSDLVVFPVLRINAMYYGWKMAFYILVTLLVALVGSALLMHYGFALFGLLPEAAPEVAQQQPADRFAFDYTFFLNVAGLVGTGVLVWLMRTTKMEGGMSMSMASKGALDRVLFWLAMASYLWLAGGVVAYFVTG